MVGSKRIVLLGFTRSVSSSPDSAHSSRVASPPCQPVEQFYRYPGYSADCLLEPTGGKAQLAGWERLAASPAQLVRQASVR